MDILKIVNQAKDIIFNPKGTMEKLKHEKLSTRDIIIYLAIVGFPTFLGILIGYGFFWWGGIGNFIGFAFGLAIFTYIFSIIGVVVFGFILNALSQNFKTKQNQMQALKLVSYAATPWLLLGIVNIFPAASLISLLGGIYGLYILYVGIPILMETPKENHMSYFIVGLIVYIVVMAIISWIVGLIWSSMIWGYYGVYDYGLNYNYPY
jgi:hypothetical protein